MRLRHFAFAALIALSLIGCTAPTASSSAPEAPVQAPAQERAAQPAAPVQNAQPPAPAPAPADAVTGKPGFDPSDPDRSCKRDSDCAVKDVGNCCGAFPICVNKDASTDPAAVRAKCAKDGMASICGFQEVSGCQCVKGRCENLTAGAVVM